MIIRIIIDFLLLILPIIFGPWVFIVLALFFVYIVKNPAEVLFVGIILNSLYYFGDNFLLDNWILLFVAVIYFVDFLLNERIVWRKFL